MILKRCFHVGPSPYRLYVLNVFSARAKFDLDTSYTFPYSVLATITLIEGVAGV